MLAYGIRDEILKLCDRYLTNRSQFIIYDNMESATHSIKCGISPGLNFGPLLFIIYMDDISNVSEL